MWAFIPRARKHNQEIYMAKKNAAPTKSEILATISKETELSKKQVGAVFDSLSASIKKSLRSHGLFTMPGLLKMKVVKKPATKAREGVNPFNGEKMMFKAKPASKKVRIAALKNLKEFVNYLFSIRRRWLRSAAPNCIDDGETSAMASGRAGAAHPAHGGAPP